MIDPIKITCYNPQQAYAAINAQIWPMLKAATTAGHRMTLELKQEKRSNAENSMLHALLGHMSKTKEWAGKKRSIDVWKRLMTAAWCRARSEHVEILPAVDGHGVDIVFRKTSELTKAECAELIEFVLAWGALEGVHFPAYVDPING